VLVRRRVTVSPGSGSVQNRHRELVGQEQRRVDREGAHQGRRQALEEDADAFSLVATLGAVPEASVSTSMEVGGGGVVLGAWFELLHLKTRLDDVGRIRRRPADGARETAGHGRHPWRKYSLVGHGVDRATELGRQLLGLIVDDKVDAERRYVSNVRGAEAAVDASESRVAPGLAQAVEHARVPGSATRAAALHLQSRLDHLDRRHDQRCRQRRRAACDIHLPHGGSGTLAIIMMRLIERAPRRRHGNQTAQRDAIHAE